MLRAVCICSVCFLSPLVLIGADDNEDTDYAELSLEQLLNVEVSSASKSKLKTDEAPGIVTVITREEIENYGMETLEDALSLAPGFTVGRSVQSGYHSSIYVRGFHTLFSETVLILWNGQRLNDAITGGATSLSQDFPLHGVKQIEIIRGPGSALYGANAFTALINIITDETEREGLVFHGSAGTESARHGLVEYGKRTGELSWNISAGYRFHEVTGLEEQPFVQFATDNPPPFDIGLPLNTEYSDLVSADQRQTLFSIAALEYKGLTARAMVERGEDENNWGTGVPRRPISDAFGSYDLTDDRYRNYDEIDVRRFGLFYHKDASEAFAWNAAVSYSDFDQTTFANFVNLQHVAQDVAGEGLGLGLRQDRSTSTLNADWSMDWRPREGHSLVAGFSYQRDDVDRGVNYSNEGDVVDGTTISTGPFFPNGDRLLKGSRDVYALYAQHTWEINAKTALTGGVRADDYSDFGSTVNPRLAFVYAPSPKASLKALYGQAFRAPTFLELNNQISGANLPNPDLDPEEMRTFEFQAIFKPVDRVRLALSAYSYQVDDVIRQVSTGNPESRFEVQARNQGERNGEGFEFEFRYQTSKTRLVYLNYAKADATDVAFAGGVKVEADVEGVPQDSLNLGIVHDLGERLLLGVTAYRRWRWTPQSAVPLQTIEIPGFGIVNVDFLDEISFPDYTQVNLNLSYQTAREGIEFLLDVENALDETMHFPDQHVFTPGGIAVGGRVIRGGVRCRF